MQEHIFIWDFCDTRGARNNTGPIRGIIPSAQRGDAVIYCRELWTFIKQENGEAGIYVGHLHLGDILLPYNIVYGRS